MKKGKVIFLNGTSSSGKTTLAWKIQDLANEPYYQISQDMFCEMWPGQYWSINPEKVFNHTISLMYHTVRMFVDKGENVVLDHVLLCDEKLKSDNGEATLEEFKKLMSGIKVLYVKVECPIEELQRREKLRGDREPGLAESQVKLLWPQDNYDIVIDTYKEDTEFSARRVLELV
jgi:chloramphenicol 3-O phosphotransferase